MKRFNARIRVAAFIIGLATLQGLKLFGQAAPVLSDIEVSVLGFVENGRDTAITSTMIITDADNTELATAFVQITNNYQQGQDFLVFRDTLGITGVWDEEDGMLLLSGTGPIPIADYQAAMRKIRFRNQSDNPSPLTRTVLFMVDDGLNPSNQVYRDISVTPVNDAPVLAAIEGTALSYTENETAKAITGTITVADADNANIASATVQITGNYSNGADLLSFTNANGISGAWSASTGTMTLTGSATLALYQTALRSVLYSNTSENPSTAQRTVTFILNDGTASGNSVTRNINITSVNDAPVLSAIEATALIYTENEAPKAITGTIAVADADNASIASATVQITGNYTSGEDVLSFTNANGISGTWSSATGSMSLTGSATLSAYQTALRNVLYSNTSENPSTAQRTVSFILNDGSAASNTVTRNITINTQNNAPVLSNIEAAALTYVENEAAKDITSNLNVTDSDNTNLVSATVQITGNYQNGADVLSFTNTAAITGTWDAVNGRMNLSGTTTVNNYRSALRDVAFSNTSDNPSTAQRTVTFIVNDGTSPSNAVTRNITLTSVNDAPSLSGIEATALTYTENEAPKQITATLSVNDPDNANLQSASVQITGNYANGQDVLSFTNANGITGTWNAGTGTMALSGSASLSAYQTALRSVLYVNTSDNPSTTARTITFLAGDGTATGTAVTRSITVISANDPPVLDNIESTTLAYTENEAAKAITGTITVADPDAGATITGAVIQITNNYQNGQDVLSFINANGISGTWTAATGTLNLSGANTLPAYQTALRNVLYSNTSENPASAQRTVVFTVTDGTATSSPVSRNISVTPVNDDPVLSGIETTALAYTENNPAVAVTGSIIVADADNINIASATVQITGNYVNAEDILSFTNANGINGTWSAATGTMTLTGSALPASYQTALRSVLYSNASDNPSALQRTVTFRVNDGTAWSNAVTRNIAITGVNDKPVLNNIETTTISYSQGDGDVLITSEITAADPDNTNMSGATVSITGTFEKTEDRLLYSAANGISGSFNTNTGVLTLTGTTSLANYQTQLRTVRYENIAAGAPKTGTRVIEFILRDGTENSDPVSRNISINSLPVLSGIETTPIIYCRNAGWVNVTTSLSISDPNDLFLTGATVSISGSFTPSEDALDFSTVSGITGSYNSSTGILTLSGTSLVSNYQTVLRSVRYRNSDGISPVDGNRIITFTVTDGKKSSAPVSRIITIDLPTAVISGTATICENTTTNLSVAMTGTSPWKFSYRRNTETPVEVLNVTASPALITVVKSGTYTLTEITDNYNCTGPVSGSAVVTITPAPVVTISGLAAAYNLDNLVYPFDTAVVSPGGGTLTNITKPTPINVGKITETTWWFSPISAGIGTYDLVYSYRSPTTLCYGYDTAVVRVLKASADIVFPGNRQYFCTNDPSVTITGINVVNATGYFTIQGGAGLIDHGNNTATINPRVLLPGNYRITYYYYDGTILSVHKDITIGAPPVASFSWETECFTEGEPINLNDNSTSSSGTINSYKWKFFKSSGYDSLMTKNVVYSYSQPGSYIVELQIVTTNGCADTLRRIFPLRPTIALAGETYFEDFEDRPVEWQSNALQAGGVNSWTLGDPFKGFTNPSSGTYCWYTYIAGTNAPREQSMITSPCFDFTGTEKPMIKLDIWRLFNATRDGAVLQASADSGRTWQNIGELRDGINWYNELSILGNPGGQTIGWSNIRDAGWLEARHGLEQLKGKKQVQFRIAYGSDGTARNNDGIAIDDFWIGERNKTALIEHFTNSSDADSKAANQMLNEAVLAHPANILDLQYHTSFPGADPFNQDNPSVSESRMLQYGLTTVPYSILDGGTKSSLRFDYELRPFDVKTALIQSLYDSKFWINLHSTLEGNKVIVNAEVMSLDTVNLAEITLHLVVIEEKVTEVTGNNGETEFRSVVKAMLPDAGGTTFYKQWSLGEYQYVNQNWTYDNIYDIQQLRIVAFMQNEQSKEVYQAAFDTVQVLSGVGPEIEVGPAANSFIIYPDPASVIARIRFAEPPDEALNLEVFNNTGRLVYAEKLPAGGNNFNLPVETLPDGLYLVRVTDSKGLSGTAKFTVRR